MYLKVLAITSIFGQKKSSALTARAMNRSSNQIKYTIIPTGNKDSPN
jgi:hypothetical protein